MKFKKKKKKVKGLCFVFVGFVFFSVFLWEPVLGLLPTIVT